MQNPDIIRQYLKYKELCDTIDCQKVIFEPTSRKEWFFDDNKWCYFEFNCEENEYRLKRISEKSFSNDCIIKDMSFEIKMLLSFARLRNSVTIEKDVFNDYLIKFEKAKTANPNITTEDFNYKIKIAEEKALERSEQIANKIMCGCLILAGSVGLLFLVAIFSYIKLQFFS